MTKSNVSNLPDARRALAGLLAEIEGAEAALKVLRQGRARLVLNASEVRGAELELERLVAKDAGDLVTKMKRGVVWVLGEVAGAREAAKASARLAQSRYESAVADKGLEVVDGEIEALEARLAELRGQKGAHVAAVVDEAAAGLREDYHAAVADLRQAMTALAGLERFRGTERLGRLVASVPDFNWTDNLPDQAVLAPQREIEKARAVFAKFAEAVADDPGASAGLLDFPVVDPRPDDGTIYSDFSPIERRRIDVQAASTLPERRASGISTI